MSSAPRPEPREPKPALVFDDPLDQQSSDDTDRGWGDRPRTDGDSAADLEALPRREAAPPPLSARRGPAR
ncbi:hypothetical protein RKD46_004920 [Streptomyces pseudovenezuelae]